MIFSRGRSFLGQINCHCSRIVTLTGVNATDRACSRFLWWWSKRRLARQTQFGAANGPFGTWILWERKKAVTRGHCGPGAVARQGTSRHFSNCVSENMIPYFRFTFGGFHIWRPQSVGTGGRGVPKEQTKVTKGTKSADLWQWQGGRGSKNPKMLRTSYMDMEAPLFESMRRMVENEMSKRRRSSFKVEPLITESIQNTLKKSNENKFPVKFPAKNISTFQPSKERGSI